MKIYHHLKALHYFLVTAQHLSIKRAAEELFVTQAAISQQIRQLEEVLGHSLFHRQHRALVLSEAGERLLPHLELAFKSLENGVNELAVEKDPNTLILAVFPSFASRWLIPRLSRFYEAHPTIAINLSMSDQYEAFGAEGIDLAIRFSSGDHEGIVNHYLMSDYIYPACHPHYAETHTIESLKDLSQLRLLDDTVSTISWDYWFEKQGLDPSYKRIDSRVRYDGSHYVVDSALSAQGVAMVRHSLVADAIAQQQLVSVLGEPVELEYQFYLCAPEQHFTFNKVRCFAEWLKKEVALFCQQNPLPSSKKGS